VIDGYPELLARGGFHPQAIHGLWVKSSASCLAPRLRAGLIAADSDARRSQTGGTSKAEKRKAGFAKLLALHHVQVKKVAITAISIAATPPKNNLRPRRTFFVPSSSAGLVTSQGTAASRAIPNRAGARERKSVVFHELSSENPQKPRNAMLNPDNVAADEHRPCTAP